MTAPISPRTERLHALQEVNKKLHDGMQKFLDPNIVELFTVAENSSLDQLVEMVQLVEILESKKLTELSGETAKLNDEARRLLEESKVTEEEAMKLAAEIDCLVHNGEK